MRFIPIARENWQEASQLRPREDQYGYVRKEAVLYSMAKAYVSPPGEYLPCVIEEDGTLVGSIRLRNYGRGVGFAAFFIDWRHQGRGLGRKAIEHLIPWVKEHYPDAGEIETAVHRDNAVARALYERLGFRYTGAISARQIMDMERAL